MSIKESREYRTRDDLERLLSEQLQLLEEAADLFDQGNEIEVKNMVVRLRVLLHDTGISKSLLGQIGKKNIQFYDTIIKDESNVITSYCGLAPILFADGKTKHVASLDDVPQLKKVDFDNWWNAIVFRDMDGYEVSRKDLVLTMANKDGGAHVDSTIDKQYARLCRGESLGRKYSKDGKNWFNMQDAVLVSIRQITHEVLKTLKPDYRKEPTYKGSGGSIMFLGGVKTFPKKSVPDQTQDSNISSGKVGRNEPCPCGSGKKYKKCCGKSKFGFS